MASNPINPNIGNVNLTRRVADSLRSVMASGKRMMTRGTFMKKTTAQLVADGKMTEREAKKETLRLAVGVKNFAPTGKKEKIVFGGMQKAGLLSAAYKNSVKGAITHFKQLAGDPANDNKEKEAEATTDDNLDKHHHMQKVRDDIEEQKHVKLEQEQAKTENYGRAEAGRATTSIEHVVHKPEDSATSSHTPGPVQLD